MRYAVILAGGSGTRLWPWSRSALPKQLLPLAQGRSLLRLAYDRLEGLLPAAQRYVCAGERHREAICQDLGALPAGQFLGEPTGRDTLSALGFSAAILHKLDPDAVLCVCTSDHVIEPQDQFRALLEQGFQVAEQFPHTLVTFGVTPTFASTAYGYLELGDALAGGARRVARFREKPQADLAREFLQAGPARYLWNSGMFVWRAAAFLDCVRRFEPEVYAGLMRIADAWCTPQQTGVIAEIYPTLKKISVDYAIMEPASRDSIAQVAAINLPLEWKDIGSWNAFADICPQDAQGNAIGTAKSILLNTSRTLVASSDPNHLITVVGGEDLIVIHTPEATLVCRAGQAEAIKELHRQVGEKYGPGLV